MPKKRNDDNSSATAAVDYVLAKREASRLVSYIGRGRSFEALSDDKLKSTFIEAFRNWSADSGNTNLCIQTDDLLAEFELRKIEPPYEHLKREMDSLIAFIKNDYETMDDTEKGEMGSDIMQEYLSDKDDHH